MGELAEQFGKSIRTIQSDIVRLTLKCPIETVRGHGGGVRLQEGYNPYKRCLTNEEERVLDRLTRKGKTVVSESEKEVLREIRVKCGSPM
jgi:predicted DNA-binding transcriptional regulator YafY